MARIDFVTGAPEKYAELVDRLSTLPGRLSAVIAGRAPQDLTAVPRTRAGGSDDEPWSVQRILAHMALYAAANRLFINQMASMQDPKRGSLDDEDSDLAQRDPAELLQVIEAEIGETVELLSRTPDAAWGRPGYVREARLSLRQMVVRHLDHLDEHIAQVAQTLASIPARG